MFTSHLVSSESRVSWFMTLEIKRMNGGTFLQLRINHFFSSQIGLDETARRKLVGKCIILIMYIINSIIFVINERLNLETVIQYFSQKFNEIYLPSTII